MAYVPVFLLQVTRNQDKVLANPSKTFSQFQLQKFTSKQNSHSGLLGYDTV